jgi:anti-sigma factor RsiW
VSNGTGHISFAQIVDLVEDRLSADSQAQAHAHTAACSHCAAEIYQVTRMIELMRGDTADDVPAPVVDRAVALFRTRYSHAPVVRRRLLAALRFDSWHTLLQAGLRGGTRSERQLLFAAESFDIDVRITRAGEVWTVAGQVLGPEQGGQVVLKGASGSLQGALTELSEFKLSPVLPDIYTLLVQLPSVEVEITGLEVGM